MILSIIIPTYNEKETLTKLFQSVVGCSLPVGWEKEIIIVDDNSTDGTKELIKGLSFGNLKLIFKKKNEGKGSALREGFLTASGDVLIIQDADLEYNPQDYFSLLQPIINKETKIVYGSRYLKPDSYLYFFDYVNFFITKIFNLFSGLNLTDAETCYKMLSKEVYLKLRDKIKSNDFTIEIEISSLIKKEKIVEIPISYNRRTYQEGKKIKWTDGVKALISIIRFNIFKH